MIVANLLLLIVHTTIQLLVMVLCAFGNDNSSSFTLVGMYTGPSSCTENDILKVAQNAGFLGTGKETRVWCTSDGTIYRKGGDGTD